jgi:nitrite reductase/ring-hydroxylating ferredoxin subunit
VVRGGILIEVRVPGAGALRHGQTLVFSWAAAHGETDGEGFVVRYGDRVYAYRNRCPHWPIPLDIGDAVFYNAVLDRIRCRSHGATFLPETGVCDSGPCGGESLVRFGVAVEGDDAIVRIP